MKRIKRDGSSPAGHHDVVARTRAAEDSSVRDHPATIAAGVYMLAPLHNVTAEMLPAEAVEPGAAPEHAREGNAIIVPKDGRDGDAMSARREVTAPHEDVGNGAVGGAGSRANTLLEDEREIKSTPPPDPADFGGDTAISGIAAPANVQSSALGDEGVPTKADPTALVGTAELFPAADGIVQSVVAHVSKTALPLATIVSSTGPALASTSPAPGSTGITPTEITNRYLYDSPSKPDSSALVSEDLIRIGVKKEDPSIATDATVDVVTYMKDGPGRFATPDKFPVVTIFFFPELFSDIVLAPGRYTEQFLTSEFGLDPVGGPILKQEQLFLVDEIDDYAERVYIWNTVAYEIADTDPSDPTREVEFVVLDDGSEFGQRFITNLRIIPFSNNDNKENFDFFSISEVLTYLTPQFEAIVDPSGIGRKVDIAFVNDAPNIPVYTKQDFDTDFANSVGNSISGYFGGEQKGLALTDSLFNPQDGPIRFLNDDEKPILYGTLEGDSISGSISVTGVDLAQHRNLASFVSKGIHYVAGPGDDTITGTDSDDVLDGGTGDDFLTGGKGDDCFIVGSGDPAGTDTITDPENDDQVKFDENVLSGATEDKTGKYIGDFGEEYKEASAGLEIALPDNRGTVIIEGWDNEESKGKKAGITLTRRIHGTIRNPPRNWHPHSCSTSTEMVWS